MSFFELFFPRINAQEDRTAKTNPAGQTEAEVKTKTAHKAIGWQVVMFLAFGLPLAIVFWKALVFGDNNQAQPSQTWLAPNQARPELAPVSGSSGINQSALALGYNDHQQVAVYPDRDSQTIVIPHNTISINLLPAAGGKIEIYDRGVKVSQLTREEAEAGKDCGYLPWKFTLRGQPAGQLVSIKTGPEG